MPAAMTVAMTCSAVGVVCAAIASAVSPVMANV